MRPGYLGPMMLQRCWWILENLVQEYLHKFSDDRHDFEAVLLTKGNILHAAAFDAYDGGAGNRERAREYLDSAIEVWRPLINRRPENAREFAFARLALNRNDEEALNLLHEESLVGRKRKFSTESKLGIRSIIL